ncbi:hypothetical protein [Azospirillum isscasi]|uniref:Uncharacterized protein n=1 Tax=Azospirillum isscasi TaxID=3053926 RepID=A0ABU0WJZ5_9PROT|nr:hypothetical protein [Azospirillum isscasi]MDQ2103909.1 hypothetical protein [Azospirillum isscasi]
MRTLFLPLRLLGAGLAFLSTAALAGEIVILDSKGHGPNHADRSRDLAIFSDPFTGNSIVIIERPTRDEELGRRDPGLEARRATRKAEAKRRSKDKDWPEEFEGHALDGFGWFDGPVPLGFGRGDPGQEAARAAADARRMRNR